MKKVTFFAFVVFAFALIPPISSFSQAGQPLANKSVPAAQKTDELTVDSVIQMLQAGLSEKIIIGAIQDNGKSFKLAPAQLIQLSAAKASDNIIETMKNPQYQPAPAVPPAQLPRGDPTPQQASLVTASSPVSSVNDENNPLANHDSGIYLFDDGKLIPLEAISTQGSTSGGPFSVRKQLKAIIPGEKAGIETNSQPVFYFYFEDRAVGLGKGGFGSSSTSPNQFMLIKLTVAKGHRETITFEKGILGTVKNVDDRAMVSFKSKRLRTGVYEVTLNEPIKPGEYCFMASTGAPAANNKGAGGISEMYDFHVK